MTGTFDVALDLPRADGLELAGTVGTLRIPDPWICRAGFLELIRDGTAEKIPVDPSGSARRLPFGRSSGSAEDRPRRSYPAFASMR